MTEITNYNNGKKKKKIAKKSAKEQADELTATESSEEELDLTKECHPISHYMDDRAEMINQMFSVIKGSKLRAMLPPILKDSDISQIKLDCLDELLGMSEKRITSILEGEILETSSESDVPSEDEDSEDNSRHSSASRNCPSEQHSSTRSSKHKRNKRKSEAESTSKNSKISRNEVETEGAPEQGKTLLEILELEMRARAIRALLKQGSDGTQNEGIKDEPQVSSDVVDLTEGDDEEFPAIVVKEQPLIEQEKTFEDKVEKTADKSKTVDEVAKKKKLIAEIELRNKLIKKKSYRTRQQRLENLEEDKPKEEPAESSEVRVKEEINPEIVIEDPEEGEVSSEEESAPPVQVKEEKVDSPEPMEDSPKPMTGERITAIDDGNFIVNANLEYSRGDIEDDRKSVEEVQSEQKIVEDIVLEDDENDQVAESMANLEEPGESNEPSASQDSSQSSVDDLLAENEDTSWRGRWLQRDEVQNVVKSSKICGKLKKSFAKRKHFVKSSPPVEVTDSELSSIPPVIEGSVSEYETLLKNSEAANMEDNEDSSQCATEDRSYELNAS